LQPVYGTTLVVALLAYLLNLSAVALGALFYSSVKCTGAPKYPYKDILVHRCTSPMNKITQGLSMLACDSVAIVYCAGLVDVYSSHSMDTRHHATRILDVSHSVWSHTMPPVWFYYKTLSVVKLYCKICGQLLSVSCKFLS